MALSLQAAMDYAVKNNVNAKNARLDIAIQDAQNKQVTAVALPQISAKGDFNNFTDKQKTLFPTGSFGNSLMPILAPIYNELQIAPPVTEPSNDNDGYEAIPITPRYSSTATITGSQILFDGGILVALQARNTIMELARQNGQLSEETIRYNVQRAYYALVIAKRQLGILANSLSYARGIASDIAALRESGFAEKIEVDRTNVQINNLATDSLRISSLITVSEQALKYQMGMDINAPIVLTDTSVENNVEKSIQLSDEVIDYNKRTEISLLNTQQKLNEFNLKRYRLAALPTLVLIGSAGYNYSSDIFSNMFQYRKNYLFMSFYGLQLNVPIFSGFKRTNQVNEVKFNIQKTQNNIDNLKLTIDFQTATAKTTLKNSLLQMQSQKRNMELAQTVTDLARKKYKAGVGSNLEVSQAQTELLNAQNNYFNSLLEVINAQSDLQKALGNFK
jgi:outer membrane protein TolC